MKNPRTQIWPFTPKHNLFRRIFEVASVKWPGKDLSFTGHDGSNIYMQEWGNPVPFTFGINEL